MEINKTARVVVKRSKPAIERLTVSTGDAAKMIGVNVNDVRDLIQLGYLKSLKLGARKIAKSEVVRFIEEATEQGIDYNEILAPYREARKGNDD
ncbi:helix-turn-helix domain-containing protein [Lacticaseibacillus saniviri]|uniref:helix-turn-helix domain-containing protein n=1 Tax=Lacticaseibacillus saniviri TaxID=931533 RepID=UPI0012E208E4|nr:helix-turn-helix domain-containing protein [Lacticaseibacillus saniviri]